MHYFPAEKKDLYIKYIPIIVFPLSFVKLCIDPQNGVIMMNRPMVFFVIVYLLKLHSTNFTDLHTDNYYEYCWIFNIFHRHKYRWYFGKSICKIEWCTIPRKFNLELHWHGKNCHHHLLIFTPFPFFRILFILIEVVVSAAAAVLRCCCWFFFWFFVKSNNRFLSECSKDKKSTFTRTRNERRTEWKIEKKRMVRNETGQCAKHFVRLLRKKSESAMFAKFTNKHKPIQTENIDVQRVR